MPSHKRNIRVPYTLKDNTIKPSRISAEAIIRGGIGLGLHLLINHNMVVTPVAEVTGDAYLLDDKVYRTNPDGSVIEPVRSMVNVFGGATFNVTRQVYISLIAGPSFTGGPNTFWL